MASELDQLILQLIDQNGSVETYSLSQQQKQDHQLFVGAVKRLQSLGDVSNAGKMKIICYSLMRFVS